MPSHHPMAAQAVTRSGLLFGCLFSSRRRHTRYIGDWSSDVCSSDLYVRNTSEKPYLAERGVSMYTMQRAYFESRLHDEAHWKRYFDTLAADRLNSFVVIDRKSTRLNSSHR